MRWPEGKQFAFTIFDDPDSQTLEAGERIYGFLEDCGFRTTKGVWPLAPSRAPSDHGVTCGDSQYRRWVQQLQEKGFEIGLHNVTPHTSARTEVLRGLDLFRDYFGRDPRVFAQHYFSQENLHWGDQRVTGWRRLIYNLLTGFRNRDRFFGHVEHHNLFWGDLCRERIDYVRNFVFGDINTLAACPYMPYHDPLRPWVKWWFASSEGSKLVSFLNTLSEVNQDRLEQEGGACIIYVHFGHGFCENGTLNSRFRDLMRRLSRKNGWFAPVSTLLDYLRGQGRGRPITDSERRQLECRWLWHKIRFGTA
jgi:hypothetical protein